MVATLAMPAPGESAAPVLGFPLPLIILFMPLYGKSQALFPRLFLLFSPFFFFFAILGLLLPSTCALISAHTFQRARGGIGRRASFRF